MGSRRAIWTVCALLALSAPSAAPAAVVDLRAVVPGHGAVTYLDLLKQAIPDLADNAADKQVEGHLAKSLRHIAGDANGGDPPDPIVIGLVEAVRIHSGGHPRLAILADLGHTDDRVAGTSLLALFDDAPTPHLLDAVDVAMDRDTSFSEHERLPLGAGQEALITYSEHSNSSQTYGFHTLIFVRHDRLALLEQIFTLSSRECGWQRTEDPTFTVRPDPHSPYGQLEVAVRVALKRDKTEDCDTPAPRPYVRTYRAAYRWDDGSQKFVTPSVQLKRLWKINQANF